MKSFALMILLSLNCSIAIADDLSATETKNTCIQTLKDNCLPDISNIIHNFYYKNSFIGPVPIAIGTGFMGISQLYVSILLMFNPPLAVASALFALGEMGASCKVLFINPFLQSDRNIDNADTDVSTLNMLFALQTILVTSIIAGTSP